MTLCHILPLADRLRKYNHKIVLKSLPTVQPLYILLKIYSIGQTQQTNFTNNDYMRPTHEKTTTLILQKVSKQKHLFVSHVLLWFHTLKQKQQWGKCYITRAEEHGKNQKNLIANAFSLRYHVATKYGVLTEQYDNWRSLLFKWNGMINTFSILGWGWGQKKSEGQRQTNIGTKNTKRMLV